MVIMQQPPILRGTEEQKIARIHNYLYQIVRDLNTALNNITEENFAEGSKAAQAASGGTEEQKKALSENMDTLRSLIIKTADNVRSEMDAIEMELSSRYTAISDSFGTYKESIDTTIRQTAADLEQSIKVKTDILTEDFGNYKSETQGYIRQGIIGYEEGVPIIGIAIGQDIRVTGESVEVDGKTYDIIDTNSSMSTWTPKKLTFFVQGLEAASFSNGALHVGVVVVDNKIALGESKWHIDNAKGFTIKWIGG